MEGVGNGVGFMKEWEDGSVKEPLIDFRVGLVRAKLIDGMEAMEGGSDVVERGRLLGLGGAFREGEVVGDGELVIVSDELVGDGRESDVPKHGSGGSGSAAARREVAAKVRKALEKVARESIEGTSAKELKRPFFDFESALRGNEVGRDV